MVRRRGQEGRGGGEVREGKEYRRGEGKEDCMKPKGHSTFMCTMASSLQLVVPHRERGTKAGLLPKCAVREADPNLTDGQLVGGDPCN